LGTQNPQVASDHGQLDASQVVDSQFVEPGADRPVLLQPADALLDRRPLPVQGRIEPVPAVVGPLVLAVRDDGTDPKPPEREGEMGSIRVKARPR
jgi:hypothetical protein